MLRFFDRQRRKRQDAPPTEPTTFVDPYDTSPPEVSAVGGSVSTSSSDGHTRGAAGVRSKSTPTRAKASTTPRSAPVEADGTQLPQLRQKKKRIIYQPRRSINPKKDKKSKLKQKQNSAGNKHDDPNVEYYNPVRIGRAKPRKASK